MSTPDEEFRRIHEEALRKAAAAYKRAKARADQIMAEPRQQLADAVREAYADGNGLKKADIIRASDHVWSRQWIDETIRTRNQDRPE
jgi:hypothetical protein